MRLQRSSPSPRYKSLQGFGKSGFSGEEYFRLLPLSVQEQFAARRRREIQEQAILRETSSGRALPSLWILVVLVLGGPGAIRAEAQAPAAPLLSKEYIYLGPRVVAVENAGSNVVKGIGIWPPSVSLGALQQQKFWAVVWGPSNTAAT